MRVTNNMMIINLKNYLQKGMQSLDKYNKQLATGKRYTLPEEDPIATQESIILNSALKFNQQYQKNIGFAQDWLLNTEQILNDVNDVLQRANELAVRGANDTNSTESRKAIAEEIAGLNEFLIQLANTRVAGNYIFSGSKIDTPAYGINYDDSSDTYTFTAYQGDSNHLETEINSGNTIEYNVNGEDIFGSNGELFQVLEDLRKALLDDNQAGIENSMGELDQRMDIIMDHLSEIGAKTNRLELSANRLSMEELNLNQLIANNEDVDMAEAIMNLKMQENVYRATLASGARIVQPSLIDFLK